MNRFSYVAIRLSFLLIILVLGLISYAPETLDLFGVWTTAQDKAEYMSETDLKAANRKDALNLADADMMLNAIDKGLKTTQYVFSKNRFRPSNQSKWWPAIYVRAIESKNSDVFEFFLSKGYECDYSDPRQGVPAFRAAILDESEVYLELMLNSNCGISPTRFRPTIEALIASSPYPERTNLLD